MCNNIKSKALGVRKRSLLLVFLFIISMFAMVACDKTVQVTTNEFELVSCYIEYRNRTNGFGGVLGTDEYLHYGYVDSNGHVTFKEIIMGYYIDFQLTEGTPKVTIRSSSVETRYTFQLTREMYNNLNSSQK